MSMDHNSGNQTSPLCRTGCGFYANQAFEGMCSKCYKDNVKRRQQNSSPSPLSGHLTSSIASSRTSDGRSGQRSGADLAGSNGLEASSTPMVTSAPEPAPIDTSTTPSIETASPTVTISASTAQEKDSTEQATASTGGAEAEAASPCDSSESDKKPKKNRCHTCKKKVGLTGFECRCGGLYCGLHRYSDKHECSFDYRELGQQQIRKANPVVIGEKIQKI